MKTRSNIKIAGIATIVIAMLAVLAVLSTPAMAGDPCFCPNVSLGEAGPLKSDPCPACSCSINGTVNGTVEVLGGETDSSQWNSYGPNHQKEEFYLNGPGTVKWARLYNHVWGGSPPKHGGVNLTFCNETGCWNHSTGIYCPRMDVPEYPNNCNQTNDKGFYQCGYGSHWLYWNVTDYATSGKNNATVHTNDYGEPPYSWDGRVMWMVLVVVFEDDTNKTAMRYWVNQGLSKPAYPAIPDAWFNGSINQSANHTLWQLGMLMDDPIRIYFNDDELAYFPSGTDDLTTHVVPNTSIQGVDDNRMIWNHSSGSFFPALAVLAEQEIKDLIVEDIEVGTPRPNKNSTITATIKNYGVVDMAWFNVSLYVDNVENGTVNVTGGLNAGNSIDVNFTNVSLSKGCYDFKVVADVDNDVTESNENNNNKTVKGQVGYVIVVESDSDFEKLNTSGDYALPTGCFKNESGTYYIQNLTVSYSIENCAGDGITIKNTNAKFVIRNCTVKNCTRSGVFFHNLKNGTIENSTVQNNSLYGIEVGEVSLGSDDPKFVNITNNTLTENNYGIFLVGFNCTVGNNTITNSTVNGIYLLANDTNITDNTIQNSTGYGVELFNSSGNYVYCNNFTDNNVTGHQACDENGNNNYWNSTDVGKNYTGNYWNDWQNNSGFPSNYTIDGGDAVDKRPKGLYDFVTGAGTDKWAYNPNVLTRPPDTIDVPDDEFDSGEYDKIKVDDGTFQSDQTSGPNPGYAAHRFNFTIAEPNSSITKINVTWNGKGWHDDGDAKNGSYLYIWNGTGYEYLDHTGLGTEVYLTNETTSDFGNYIDSSGIMTVLVVQKSERGQGDDSHIETDYVRVAVIATP